MRFLSRCAQGQLRLNPIEAFADGVFAITVTLLVVVSFFGCVMAINTIAFIVMHRYILRHLIKPEFAEAQPSHVILKWFVGVVSYLAGAACAWFSADVAFAV